MATGILIIGEPGTGKSTSIRTLPYKETVIITPNTKDLPFPGGNKQYKLNQNLILKQTFKGVGDTLTQINAAVNIKYVVIEDFTHLVAKRVIDEASDKGYDKWTALAASIKTHIIDKLALLRPDLFVVMMGHVEISTDAMGVVSIELQTPGKLLDRAVKIASYFTYLLHTFVDIDKKSLGIEYKFLTNRDLVRSAKTPMGCFPLLIDNDLLYVIDRIKQYRMDEGITPIGKSLEDLAKLKGKAVAAPATTAKPATTEPVDEKPKEEVGD